MGDGFDNVTCQDLTSIIQKKLEKRSSITYLAGVDLHNPAV